jgi:geranylgeranyl diphosphate synthase type II
MTSTTGAPTRPPSRLSSIFFSDSLDRAEIAFLFSPVASSTLTLPRTLPTQRFRPPKRNIPQTAIQRNHILQRVREYVAEHNPVPPLPLEELKLHADAMVALLGCDPVHRDYIGILINNEMWRETLATVPCSRRLLLLPKCLRAESKCPAPFDEFGLLCKQCGLCTIQDLQSEAERLGYAVLVAEGSAIVMALIQTGKIEAIVGVSCISVLERAFPYMEAAAIPGVAIPLLQDDCIDTTVDLDWVWDYIHLTSDDKTRRLDLGALRDEVESWFSRESLAEIMGPISGETEQIAREWLQRAGKRWRPFLTVAAFQALRDTPEAPLPPDIRKIAVAVECFHKASLVHDDIEDQDAKRYGQETLHQHYGVPVALNAGDLLVGEGYRLLAESAAAPAQKADMIRVAAGGHRRLCLGQGAELCWTRRPEPLSAIEVLDIFRQKTAPAFEVALQLGAVYSGKAEEEIQEALHAYSEALGIAYQIRDDLDDLSAESGSDIDAMRMNLPLAVAYERAAGGQKALLERAWRRLLPDSSAPQIVNLCLELHADERARSLLNAYKEQAIRSLQDVDNANLKGLLRRVIGKIFSDTEIKGWCKEFEALNKIRAE